MLKRASRECLVLLQKQSSKSVLLAKVAHSMRSRFEEHLKVPSGDFPHPVDLLDQLLKQVANVFLVELTQAQLHSWLVGLRPLLLRLADLAQGLD